MESMIHKNEVPLIDSRVRRARCPVIGPEEHFGGFVAGHYVVDESEYGRNLLVLQCLQDEDRKHVTCRSMLSEVQ
ncbi:hypothetical protein JZ751_022558 [Albula glossodonta]|uniref:Uncharacterized protein n=1 Tax=Albula glossodonta TaxID=121402 RepID=A0A8T2PM52_9TELE|nr:hypothetical protein JZ751_022558 [Albula glossodonta]